MRHFTGDIQARIIVQSSVDVDYTSRNFRNYVFPFCGRFFSRTPGPLPFPSMNSIVPCLVQSLDDLKFVL
jgi:hypothetical protein